MDYGDHEPTTDELLDQTDRLLIQSRQLLEELETQLAEANENAAASHH